MSLRRAVSVGSDGLPSNPVFADPSKLPQGSKQINMATCAVVTWVFTALFVGLRVYTRRYLIKVPFRWEDGTLVTALVFSAVECASQIWGAVHGAGRHIWDIPPENIIPMGQGQYVSLLFYVLTLATTKVSILLFYLEIFKSTWIRIAGWIVLAVTVTTSLWSIASILTICVPLAGFWDMRITNARCWPQNIFWGNATMHVVTDFLIFLLPIPGVWRLNVPRRQRYVVIAIFSLGFLVCFISIVRLIYMADTLGHPDPDATYTQISIAYWTSIETNFAIITACVMSLRPLLSRLFPGFLAGSSESHRQLSGESKFVARLDSPVHLEAGADHGIAAVQVHGGHQREDGNVQTSRWLDSPSSPCSPRERNSGSLSTVHAEESCRELSPTPGPSIWTMARSNSTLPMATLLQPPPSKGNPNNTFLDSESEKTIKGLPTSESMDSLESSTFGHRAQKKVEAERADEQKVASPRPKTLRRNRTFGT